MSTLAAVQADGYYYPPDWTPADGMKNKFRNVGCNSLRLISSRGRAVQDLRNHTSSQRHTVLKCPTTFGVKDAMNILLWVFVSML